MNDDLANLRDILEPEPVTWWPLAVGWWFLIALLLLTLTAMVIWWTRRWRARAYRRQALAELNDLQTPLEIAQLLKRTALDVTSREDVAALCGPAWIQWLEKTGGQAVPESVARQLGEGTYDGTTVSSSGELREFAVAWIEHHQEVASC